MDKRIQRILNEDMTYDMFRSELIHYLKYNSVQEYISCVIHENMIQVLWDKKEYAKALYILSLFDFYAHIYQVDVSALFTKYRTYTLDKPLTPPFYKEDKRLKDDLLSQFFMKHNIVEYFSDDEKKAIHAYV